MVGFDKVLATILVKHGVLAEDRSEAALTAAGQARKSLTRHLIDEDVSESDIIGAVSAEEGLPPIDLAKVEIDEEAKATLSKDFAAQNVVVPVAKLGETLTLAVANPRDVVLMDNVRFHTTCRVMVVVSTDVSIRRAIRELYDGVSDVDADAEMEHLVSDISEAGELELADEDENADAEATMQEPDRAPVIRLVRKIVIEAVKAKASDIHIEPYEKRTRVRYRVDGACFEKVLPASLRLRQLHNNVVSRIKVMSKMDIASRRRPQDGRFRLKHEGREIDFRVSILPIVHGEKAMLRILDSQAAGGEMSLDKLGFEEKALGDFSEAVQCANGLVLVTGPTGCGKTVTLYAAMEKIQNVQENITTVEDPVERSMTGVNQVQANAKAKLGFADALRSILRQDPDKVLLGEIRDEETAEIAVKAALTGHLVLSTLHTNDAPTTITRLVNMGVPSFLVSSCVILVSAQRLVRKLCPTCRKPYKASAEQMRKWGFSKEEIGEEPNLYAAVGCKRCRNGYSGRRALLETLPVNNAEIRKVIEDGGTTGEIKGKALEQGMVTLRRVGVINALKGVTTMEQVRRNTMSDR